VLGHQLPHNVPGKLLGPRLPLGLLPIEGARQLGRLFGQQVLQGFGERPGVR
jgi:hypothetical protein